MSGERLATLREVIIVFLNIYQIVPLVSVGRVYRVTLPSQLASNLIFDITSLNGTQV